MANKRHSWNLNPMIKDIENENFDVDRCNKCGKLRMKTRSQSTGKPTYHYFDSEDDYEDNWYEERAGECK